MELKQARVVIAEIAHMLNNTIIQIVEDIQPRDGQIRANFKGTEACLTFQTGKATTPNAAFTIKRDGTVNGLCIKKVLHIKDYYLDIPPWHWRRDLRVGTPIVVGAGLSLLLDPTNLSTKKGKKEICRFLEAGLQTPGSRPLIVLL